MAGGGVIGPAADPHVSYYKGKLTTKLALAILVAAMGGALFGYDLGVTGGVGSQKNFLAKFFPDVHSGEPTNAYCAFNDWKLQLFTSSLFLAAAFAGLAADYTTRRLGRVNTMGLGGCFFILGALLTGGAVHIVMLIIGRLSLGVGVGLCCQSVPTYLAEVSPPNLRGMLSIMFQLAVTIGIIVAQLINYGFSKGPQDDWAWRVPLLVAGVPALVLVLGWFGLPESPQGLVERGHMEKAETNLQIFRGTADVSAEFRDLMEAVEIAKKVDSPWLSIFKRQYRPELSFATLIPFFQQFTGINSIMFYAPMIFATMGGSNDVTLLNTVIVGAINVGATGIAIFTVDKAGRRWLFTVGGLIMITAQVVVCVALAVWLDPAGKGSMPEGAGILVLIAVCAFTAAFAFSWGPLGWLVPSEIQSLQTRSGGMAITTFINFLATFVVGQSFLSMMCSMKSFVYLFFAAFVVAMTIFIWLLLPETKQVPVEEMGLLWASHWYWRRYAAAENRPLPVTLEMETQTGPSLVHLGQVMPTNQDTFDEEPRKDKDGKRVWRAPARPTGYWTS